METVMSHDALGRKFVAYRVKLSDGSYIEMDADLADLYPGGPEAFVVNEVELHKRQLGT